MTKSGRKKRPKRSRPVHGRQSKKRLQQEVKSLYGNESGSIADDDDRDWQSWEDDRKPSKPGVPQAKAAGGPAVGSAEESLPPKSGAPAESAAATMDGQSHQGLLVSLASGLCWVEVEGGDTLQAVLPSRWARSQRSQLAVGDQVRIAQLEDGTWRLEDVLPRRTELSRPDPHNPRRQRLIAANIDDVVIVASVVAPPLRPALIDRYLITVDRGGAQPLIVINKIDLLPDAAAREQHLSPLTPYRDMGLRIIPCSTQTGEGLDAVTDALAGRTAVVVGHSGVGKSSLLNALDPSFALQTGAVGDAGSGRHTTTRSGLYALRRDIRLIDTPGIRELGLGSLDPLQLQFYFPELAPFAQVCHFSNCTHLHEPRCGVRQAVADDQIAEHRFATYRRLMNSLQEDDLGYD